MKLLSLFKELILSTSDGDKLKSKIFAFSAIWEGVFDFGSTPGRDYVSDYTDQFIIFETKTKTLIFYIQLYTIISKFRSQTISTRC